MAHFVGLDVSVKETSVCVVDEAGQVISQQQVPTEPTDIIALLTSLGVPFGRIGIEAGPLSQWLVNALTAADLPVICVETRHMKALLTAQQINKTDRNDARGMRRAIVAVARRLAVVLHRMWVDGSEFRWSKDSTAVPAIV